MNLDRDVLKAALADLGRSDRFRAEVAQRLLAKGHAEAHISEVLDFLEKNGFQNDARTLENLKDRALNKPDSGRLKLRQALEKRGFDPADAEAIVAEFRTDTEEAEAADAVLARYARPEFPEAKLARTLLNRGFEPEIVEEAVRRYHRDSPLRD